ncbi:MAG TPA: DegQ family serine endoprotease [Acidobacteriaceae bacterium]|nr:DegQ family serine endoprotease [Acidobacteriaceae bacterium]
MTPQTRKFPVWLLVLAALLLIVGGLLRAGVLHVPGYRVIGTPRATLHLATNVPPVGFADFKNGFASVIDPALPAVVNISSTKMVKQQNMPNIFADPFFRQFFGNQFGQQNQPPQMEREHSLGSGVIVNPDGYILTNNHVVAGASDVEIFTQAQSKYKAKVIGTDPRTDVAVLKIEGSGFPSLTLGDSSQLKVGDLVFAIGDPFGIGETATMGIVSAKGRALGGTVEHYEDFIQTDAAINPGNSGGALIDMHGNLIGINTAILSGGGGGNEGIGFAIPIDMARNVMDQIVEHGKVVRGYLGVSIQAVSPDIAKQFGLSHGGGALVSDVTSGSPAAKAGLLRGDIILKLNGEDVSTSSGLSLRISEMAPGSVAQLQVFRDGHTQNLDVTLGSYPEKGQPQQASQSKPANLNGLQVEDLTHDLAQQLGLPLNTSGVVVSQVDPTSAAAAAGVQRGDVIQEVDRKPVHNLAEYQKAISGLANQPVLLLLNRGGATLFVVVEPQG